MTVPALSIRGLSKTYANGLQALTGIDLSVQQGDFFALLGPNGAGKSTTIGVICSLVVKSAGKVEVFGLDTDHYFTDARRLIGVVPQEFNFSIFETVGDIVATQAGFYGIGRSQALTSCKYWLQRLGLWDKRNEQARHLSGGMKRRLLIARALVHHPRLLILDEPSAGVDIELRRSMWEFLRELNQRGVTIILTTHYLEEAESLCRNIAIIDHGRIVQNTSMRELLAQLQVETFVLDVQPPGETLPVLDGCVVRRLDDHSLEVDVRRGQNLSQVFAQLEQSGLQVVSLRNKSNRLEQLFVSLIGDSGQGDARSVDGATGMEEAARVAH